jgi:hypothetical protein
MPYEYLALPFGLNNGPPPPTFQALMNSLFGVFALVIVLQTVLSILRENNSTLTLATVSFFVTRFRTWDISSLLEEMLLLIQKSWRQSLSGPNLDRSATSKLPLRLVDCYKKFVLRTSEIARPLHDL